MHSFVIDYEFEIFFGSRILFLSYKSNVLGS